MPLESGTSASAQVAVASPDWEMCVEKELRAHLPLPSGVRYVL